MNTMHNKTNKGFTLLEILLVITLIGILSAIALVAINPNRQLAQARNLKRKSDINAIYNALEMYAVRNRGVILSTITTSYQEICNTGTESSSSTTTSCTGKLDLRVLVPTYITSIPRDTQADTGNTGYEVAKDNKNQIRIRATKSELGEVVAVNEFCPTNYIAVPGNSLYQTKDFCVMKYEAKTGSATIAATTQAAGTPTVSINQTNSITACSLNGAGYGLINNREWMTIARNIEAQSVNWTGGAVGSGGLWRGHSDSSPANALAASADNDPYNGTGNVSPSIERRTHTLSNGEVIWDLSGNVWEWTSDTIQGQNKPNNSSGNVWQEWTDISNFGTLSYDLTRPSNPAWNSTQNMGRYYAGTVTGTTNFAFLRAGGWADTASAGVFLLYLYYTPAISSNNFGFRCVLR